MAMTGAIISFRPATGIRRRSLLTFRRCRRWGSGYRRFFRRKDDRLPYGRGSEVAVVFLPVVKSVTSLFSIGPARLLGLSACRRRRRRLALLGLCRPLRFGAVRWRGLR